MHLCRDVSEYPLWCIILSTRTVRSKACPFYISDTLLGGTYDWEY